MEDESGLSPIEAVIANMMVKDIISGGKTKEKIFEFTKDFGWDRDKFDAMYSMIESIAQQRIKEMGKEDEFDFGNPKKSYNSVKALIYGLFVALLIIAGLIFSFGEGVFFSDVSLVKQGITSLLLATAFGVGFILVWVFFYKIIEKLFF